MQKGFHMVFIHGLAEIVIKLSYQFFKRYFLFCFRYDSRRQFTLLQAAPGTPEELERFQEIKHKILDFTLRRADPTSQKNSYPTYYLMFTLMVSVRTPIHLGYFIQYLTFRYDMFTRYFLLL